MFESTGFFGPDGFYPSFGPPWWFILIAGIILFLILSQVIRGISTWSKNNASPILTTQATVIGKRTRTDGGGNDTHVSTSYFLTFQYASGERAEFHVSGQEYGLLIEGDTGRLTYQGTRYKGFQRR